MKFFEILICNDEMDSIGFLSRRSTEYLDDFKKLNTVDSLLQDWHSLTLEFQRDEGTKNMDVYDTPYNGCVLHESAELFSNIENLELLPFNATSVPSYCPNAEPFGYLFHFTSPLKLLDGSIVEYFPATNGISHIEKAVLPCDAFRNRQVFQIEGTCGIYCTSEFRKSFCARNMTGVVFEDLSGIFECAAE